MNTKDSALSLDARVYLHDIEKADLLVGIPSFNNVLTASYVLSQVIKGLDTYFPNFRSVIFVSDGNSKDDTLTSVKMVDLPSEVKLIPAIYMGLSGKGEAVRAIFEAASYLKVKSVALVDSDLRSITPEWMHLLINHPHRNRLCNSQLQPTKIRRNNNQLPLLPSNNKPLRQRHKTTHRRRLRLIHTTSRRPAEIRPCGNCQMLDASVSTFLKLARRSQKVTT